MEKNSTTLSQERKDELRQYVFLKKYEKIVNQFDEMMEKVDAITKTPKRRRISDSKRNKLTSVAAASNSASATCKESSNTRSISAPADDIIGEANSNAEAVEAKGSKVALPGKAEKYAALEQIITKQLNDLQTDCGWEFGKNLDK